MGGHPQRTYVFLKTETGIGSVGGETGFDWDAEGWAGGDDNKLWLKSEGEVIGGEAEHAEVQALWSRNVSEFFDVQAGLRQDFEPDATTYAAVGIQGLAPYQFETEATAFLSDRGDVSFRFKQSIDLRLTQSLVLEPEGELEASISDVPERGLGAGLTRAEAKLRLRYEVTRKLAPYVEVGYARLLGETGDLAAAAGHDRGETALRVGLRAWVN